MSQFDASARDWDNNPLHWERSAAIARILRKAIPFLPGMKALEFGAGTGIISFMLKDNFTEITLMDSSREMVKVMQEKADEAGLNYLKPLFFDLETREYADGTFDCIYTQMAMHHVGDIALVINRFYHLLNPGGWLAVADLYTEDGSFHNGAFSGHKGFEPDELRMMMENAGFKEISVRTCFEIKKIINGNQKEFPVFLMIARK